MFDAQGQAIHKGLQADLNRLQRQLDEQHSLYAKQLIEFLPTSETSMDAKLLADLAVESQAVKKADRDLALLKNESAFTRIAKWPSLRAAKWRADKALSQKSEHEASAEATTERQQYVTARNQQARQSAQTRAALSAQIESAKADRAVLQSLSTKLAELVRVHNNRGWMDVNTVQILQLLAAELGSGVVTDELGELIQRLTYQKMPSEQVYESWTREAAALLKVASASPIGFLPTKSYKPIVLDSLKLQTDSCVPSVSQQLSADEDCADQWQHAAKLLSDAKHHLLLPHWAIYWANFKVAQEFSEDLADAKAHEDNHSGAFMEKLRENLKTWAGSRIDMMGYPHTHSVLGTFSIGGMSPEARLGADIGVLVDIQVGDLKVRKVAIIQCKVSENGSANVGSDPTGPKNITQLRKLNDPQRDFHLFFHRPARESKPILPTVIHTSELLKVNDITGVKLDQKSVTVKTRKKGWDWASFMAFGLCSASSGVGRLLQDGEDALTVMGGGDRSGLPAHMILVTVGGGDYEYAMKQLLRQHYIEYGTALARSDLQKAGPDRDRGRSRNLSRDDFGMDL